jgi:flagellar biosynthesis regulator FlbT
MSSERASSGRAADCTAVHYTNNPRYIDIDAYLRTCPDGTAHPWVIAGRRFLLIKRGDSIVKLDITDTDPQSLINQANVSELSNMLARLIDRHPQLAKIRDFALQMTNPGDRIEISVNAAEQVVVITDKKDSNYFDAVGYFRNRTLISTLTYSKKECMGANHSGDIGSLLHCMGGFNSTELENIPMTFAVIGYNRRFLRNFMQQQPSVLLIDYDRKVIYIVPCPLDAASVGDATLAHLVAARVVNGTMLCDVLRRPITVNNVNTGDTSDRIRASVDLAIAEVTILEDARAAATQVAQATQATQVAQAASATAEPADDLMVDASAAAEAHAFTATVFVQNQNRDKKINHGIIGAQTVYFGQGFTLEPEYTVTTLPHVFGRVEGGMSPALCSPPEVVPVKTQVSIVYICSAGISDSNARMMRVWGNVPVIIEAGIPLGSDVEATLNQVDVAAACMAGPNAVVIIRFGDRLFWYRGVRIPGLVAKVPCYADEVTHLFCAEALNAWLATSPVLPWPQTQETTDRHVFFAGRMMKIAEVIQILSTIDFHGLVEATPDIIDFLTQASVLMESAEIKDFVAQIDSYLTAMIEKEVVPLKATVLEAYSSGNARDIKAAVAEMKGVKTRMSKVIHIISNALANLDSVRGISKKTQSIARRQRATKISANVDRAKTMTMAEKFNLFEKYCDSMLILSLEPSNLVSCLTAIGAARFRPMIRATGKGIQFIQDGRMPFLDPDTFSSLLELTYEGAEHPLAGPQNMAIPLGHTAVARRLPAIAFPLLRKAIALRDPSLINWADEANEEWYSLFRIMLRGMFAQATASRAFNIPAQSDDLGFFLIHLILCAMESIVSGMSNVPNQETDWDSTNCEAMRGLFGQLLSLMASTNKTLCPAYLLVYKGAQLRVLDNNEWWVVNRMVRLFPYTCWDSTVFLTNVRHLITLVVHKQIVGPPTEAMRKLVAKEKYIQKERDPAWYAYMRVVIDVMMWAAGYNQDGPAPGLTPAMAITLLELSPPVDVLSRGTQMMTDFIFAIRQYLYQVAAGDDWSTGFTRTVMIALFSFVKHSGCVTDLDKVNVRTRIHAAATVAEYVAIYDELSGGVAQPEWTTTYEGDHAEKVAMVTGYTVADAGSADAGSADTGSAGAELAVALPPPTLSEILALFPGSAGAVAIAQNLPLMTLADSQLPPELADLMILIGLEPVPALRAMIEAMLMSWRSYDSSIDAGISVLSDRRNL